MNRYRLSVFLAAAAFLARLGTMAFFTAFVFGGVTAADRLDLRLTLIAPAGFYFGGGAIVDALLCWYLVAQVIRAFGEPHEPYDSSHRRLNVLFVAMMFLQTSWAIAWQGDDLELVVLFAAAVMLFLGAAQFLLAMSRMNVRAAFGAYFGWMAVMLVMSVATWLAGRGTPTLDAAAMLSTIVVLYGLLALASAQILLRRDPAFGLAVLLGFIALLVRYLDPDGFADGYPALTTTAVIAIGILLLELVLVLIRIHTRVAGQRPAR